MITVKELAARCGVSIATISNILNGKSNVSEETKQRVLKIIKETSYTPNYMASRLRATKTKTIGLIIDDLTAFSTPSLVDGILDICENAGYKTVSENLRIYTKYENQPEKNEYKENLSSIISQLLAYKVEGIIFIAANSREVTDIPENLPVPVVVAYAYTKAASIPTVEIDDYNAAYETAKYLLSKGKTKLAVIGGAETSIHDKKRIEGFEDALDEADIDFSKVKYIPGNWDRQGGYNACKKILSDSNSETPDAIFCFNDLMAAGAYDYLYEEGKIPGKDIAIIGFDNREVSEYLNPPLTTMEIPLKEIGRKAAEVMFKKINNQKTDCKAIKVPCTFIERKSV